MKKIPYMDYKKLVGSYTVCQVADMLNLDTPEFYEKAQQYNIRIRQDDKGRYYLDSTAIKILHYRLYHESKGRRII